MDKPLIGGTLNGGAYQISVISSGGDFRFYADEQADGSHTYQSTYAWEHGWLLTPQAESGQLSDKDWQSL